MLRITMFILLLLAGVYFTIAARFFQFTHIALWLKKTIGSMGDRRDGISPFRAMTTSLAGTVGIGNIAGVATAICAGGPGAVFWMWMSAVFGMMTKYAEIVLGVKYRRVGKNGFYGGPMYYIEAAGGKPLAVIFSVCCLASCMGMGSMTQSNAVAAALNPIIPNVASGVATALFVGLATIGGMRSISRVTEVLVPLMAAFYIIGSVVCILIGFESVPATFRLIFSEAFSFKSAGGGVLGYGIMRAMRYGLARGVFTNEAGIGTAAMAHSAANAKSPEEQGMWGIFEVFFDTIIICTLTALVILNSGEHQNGFYGVELTVAAFSKYMGGGAVWFLNISVTLFAVSSIIGWCYYGQCCTEYLFGERKSAVGIYKALFVMSVMLGTLIDASVVWELADSFNAAMAMPNLVALIMLGRCVYRYGCGRRLQARDRQKPSVLTSRRS